MKKLEDIPKADIFKTPDGYFDTLPSIVQARITRRDAGPSMFFRFSFKYALPVAAIVLGLVWLLNMNNGTDEPEQILAAIEASDLIEYMEETDMIAEDFLESLDYAQIHADSLDLYESEMPLSDFEWNELTEEIETETL
jgi:hypothetical protein